MRQLETLLEGPLARGLLPKSKLGTALAAVPSAGGLGRVGGPARRTAACYIGERR